MALAGATLAFALVSARLHWLGIQYGREPGAVWAAICWLLSVLGFMVLAWRWPESEENRPTRCYRRTVSGWVVLGLAIAVGLFLRSYKLTHLGWNWYEAMYWELTQKILDGTVRTPFGDFHDTPSNWYAFFYVPVAAVFSDAIIAHRLVGLFESFVTGWFVFRIANDFWSPRAGYFAAGLSAFSVWDIHISQRAIGLLTVTPVLIVGTLYFLLRSVLDSKPRYLAATGLFLGLALNTFYISTMMVLVVAVVWGRECFVRKGRLRWELTCLLLGAFLVTSTPSMIRILREDVLHRHKVFVELNQREALERKSPVWYYVKQAGNLATEFLPVSSKTQNRFLWGIVLDFGTFVAFLIGLCLAIAKIRDPRYLSLVTGLFAYLLVIVVPMQSDSIWRQTGFHVFILVLAAVAVDALASLSSSVGWRRGILGLASVGLLSSWAILYGAYYRYQLAAPEKHPEVAVTQLAEALRAIPHESYEVWIREQEERPILLRSQLSPGARVNGFGEVGAIESRPGRNVLVAEDLFSPFSEEERRKLSARLGEETTILAVAQGRLHFFEKATVTKRQK